VPTKATLIALESPALAQYTFVPLNKTVHTVDPLINVIEENEIPEVNIEISEIKLLIAAYKVFVEYLLVLFVRRT
jgi:hypothetical protein